jgi:Domain of unknown function (DUF6484)
MRGGKDMAKVAEAVPDAAQKRLRLDGVVIGVLMGFDHSGAPLVVFPGNPVEHAVPARTTAKLEHDDVGAEVALLFEQGDPARPLVMGRILHPEVPLGAAGNRRLQATIDDQRLELKAEREIVLRCGKASITLTRAGKILLRGAYIFSRSTGVNKIKGGSVQLN